MALTQLPLADGQHDLIHEEIAEFHVLVGAALLQRPEDLKLGVFLADAPVGHEPNPKTHFVRGGGGRVDSKRIENEAREMGLWRPQEGVGGCVVAAGGPEVGAVTQWRPWRLTVRAG